MQKTLGQLLDDPREWFRYINGVWTSMTVLRMLNDSGLLHHLEDEPVGIAELSRRTGLLEDKLTRLLNYLAAQEVIALTPDNKVGQTPRSRFLQANMSVVGVSLHAMEAGKSLVEAMQKGVTPYEIHFGKPCFDHFADEPETARNFAGMMVFMTGIVSEFVFSQHQFQPFDTAVDVGGSHGEFLLELLAHHPDARGVLYDLPDVTAMVADSIRQSPQGERVEIVAGNFFESVPEADLYLIKMILHDWSDEESVRILRVVHRAVRPGGRVVVIEHLLPESPRPHPANSIDIAMMVWSTGRERKRSEFETLFAAAGFRIDRLVENPAGPSVMELVAT